MKTNKRKKNTRMRGKTTHGLGSKKKGRGAGNRGGRGMAGTGKRADQKKPTILKLYGNSYFGKRGFKSKRKKKKALNFESLNKLIEKGLIKKEGDKYLVNLKELGYDKLLCKGELNYKIKFTSKSASKKALEKIKEKGGEVVTS